MISTARRLCLSAAFACAVGATMVRAAEVEKARVTKKDHRVEDGVVLKDEYDEMVLEVTKEGKKQQMNLPGVSWKKSIERQIKSGLRPRARYLPSATRERRICLKQLKELLPLCCQGREPCFRKW